MLGVSIEIIIVKTRSAQVASFFENAKKFYVLYEPFHQFILFNNRDGINVKIFRQGRIECKTELENIIDKR